MTDLIETIFPGFFRIAIPLPGSPLQAINSYVIKAKDRTLIIDTGLNRMDNQEVVLNCIKEIGVPKTPIDFFITHCHADHAGLLMRLATSQSRVFVHSSDARWCRDMRSWEGIEKVARVNGFPGEKIGEAIGTHPGYLYRANLDLPITHLKNGDCLATGQYRFFCLHTPGHTIGHQCLYESGRKILITGDHVLGSITPSVQPWFCVNPLGKYLQSLEMVNALDVDLALPGHGAPIGDFHNRVRELKDHHALREGEILSFLRKETGNAFQLASKMKWDIGDQSWVNLPSWQKLLALGETISHLRFMEAQGRIQGQVSDGMLSFMPYVFHLADPD